MLRPAPGVNPVFLYWLLRLIELPSAGYSRHFKYLRERGSPPAARDAQDHFADFAIRVEIRRQQMKQAAGLSESLFAALQQKAYKGAL